MPRQRKGASAEGQAGGHEIGGFLQLEDYVALADFAKTEEQQMNLVKGERVQVVRKEASGWWFVSTVERVPHNQGFVPGAYVEPAAKPGGGGGGGGGGQDAGAGAGTAPEAVERYVVTAARTAEREDELRLVAGAVVVVHAKNADGWWQATYNGKRGLAPGNFLTRLTIQAHKPSKLARRCKGISVAQLLHSKPPPPPPSGGGGGGGGGEGAGAGAHGLPKKKKTPPPRPPPPKITRAAQPAADDTLPQKGPAPAVAPRRHPKHKVATAAELALVEPLLGDVDIPAAYK